MAWEDVGDEERELLEAVDAPARQAHYRAVTVALLYFGITLGVILALWFLVYLAAVA